MKKTTVLVPLLLVMSGTCRLFGQAVTLGDASFDATSDQIAAEWFMPMVPGTTSTFEGTGANAGQTRTETYSLGDAVAGVKAVKRHIEGSSAAVAAEDWWIARDANDDLRVLKLFRAGAVVFEASATAGPPKLMPGSPTVGQTWELFGATLTVGEVTRSLSGGFLKITETSGASVTACFYRSHFGLTQAESEAGDASAAPAVPGATFSPSGWRGIAK